MFLSFLFFPIPSDKIPTILVVDSNPTLLFLRIPSYLYCRLLFFPQISNWSFVITVAAAISGEGQGEDRVFLFLLPPLLPSLLPSMVNEEIVTTPISSQASKMQTNPGENQLPHLDIEDPVSVGTSEFFEQMLCTLYWQMKLDPVFFFVLIISQSYSVFTEIFVHFCNRHSLIE